MANNKPEENTKVTYHEVIRRKYNQLIIEQFDMLITCSIIDLSQLRASR